MDDSIQIIEDKDDEDDVVIIDEPNPKQVVPIVILCDSDDDDDDDTDNNTNQNTEESDKSELNCSRVDNTLINQVNKEKSDWYNKYKTQGRRSPYYTCPECLASLSTVYMIDRHFQARHPKSVHRFQKNKDNHETLHILSDSEETGLQNKPETLPSNSLSKDNRLSPLKEKNNSGSQCLKLIPLPTLPKRPVNSGTNSTINIEQISIPSTPVTTVAAKDTMIAPLPPLAPIKPIVSTILSSSSTCTVSAEQSGPTRNITASTPLRVMISGRDKKRVVKVNSRNNSTATQESTATKNSNDMNSLGAVGICDNNSKGKDNIWTRLARIKNAIVSGNNTNTLTGDQGRIREYRKAKRRPTLTKFNSQGNSSKVNDGENSKGQVAESIVIQDNTVESSSQSVTCWNGILVNKKKRKRGPMFVNDDANQQDLQGKRAKVDASNLYRPAKFLQKPITCRQCNKRFSNFSAKKNHMNVFHKKKASHSTTSPILQISQNPPNIEKLSQMKHIVLIDVDNWRKILECDLKFSPSTFVWAFHGGSTSWQPSQSSMILKHLQDKDCFYLHPKSGSSKDAADFALCVQAGKLDVQLPKEIPFTVLSGDSGFRELQNQLSLSKREVHLVNPHHKTTDTVLTILNSIADKRIEIL